MAKALNKSSTTTTHFASEKKRGKKQTTSPDNPLYTCERCGRNIHNNSFATTKCCTIHATQRIIANRPESYTTMNAAACRLLLATHVCTNRATEKERERVRESLTETNLYRQIHFIVVIIPAHASFFSAIFIYILHGRMLRGWSQCQK